MKGHLAQVGCVGTVTLNSPYLYFARISHLLRAPARAKKRACTTRTSGLRYRDHILNEAANLSKASLAKLDSLARLANRRFALSSGENSKI